jgi:single-stranded-DNA-specific exonuclease
LLGVLNLEKCVVLAHGDGDGICSAALASAFLKKSCEVSVHFTHPVGLLQDLKMFASPGNTITIVDIAVDELSATELMQVLEEYAGKGLVIYIDHHPLPESFKVPGKVVWIHDNCCSASELAFRYFREGGLDKEFSRVALYGAISDYLDETPWVKRELWKWDRRSVFLEAGIVCQGLEGAKRDYDFKRAVVEHLAKNMPPSQMLELVTRSIKQAEVDEKLRFWVKENVKVFNQVAYVLNPPGSVGKAANYAKIYSNAEVGIAVEERRDVLVMSLRGRGECDLNTILRKLSKKLGIHGGGHPAAAGARMPKNSFQKFLEELNQELAACKA